MKNYSLDMGTDNKKLNIIYLFPGPIYRPNSSDFKDRFEMLSEFCEGEVYSWTCDKAYQEYVMDNFVFRGVVVRGGGFITRLRLAIHIIRATANLSKRKKVDVIICYDPIFTGIVGAFLKMVFRCKLIIELNNSDFVKAMQIEGGKSLKTKSKIILSNLLFRISLLSSDGIKILTDRQKDNLLYRYNPKRIFCFHDFVSTSFFEKDLKKTDKYLLFVGYPFYRKGIDIFVKAFEKIADQFPDFEILLIGHQLQDEAKNNLGTWCKQVKFIKPMFYEELKPYFLNCYGFVLPSREEGMGRVLIEAMACAKPLIGANVGGIPALINDGENGLLFESEDIDDLAQKLTLLLKDKNKARAMGEIGFQLVKERFSSKLYCDYFMQMVQEIVDNEK